MSQRWGKTKAASGPASKYRSSPWLASEDLLSQPDGFVVMTIMDALDHTGVQFSDGRSEDVLSFGFVEMADRPEEEQKRMVINQTNLKECVKRFGPNIENFFGHKVKIYIDPNVESFGKIVSGLRITGEDEAIPKPAQKAVDALAKMVGGGK